jgi:hypothetical protein
MVWGTEVSTRAFVRLRLPDGGICVLEPGDIIGRSWSAALSLDDGRISEAHALVSLRGRSLKLLPLRGRLAVQGKLVEHLDLAPEQVIELAAGLTLVVEAVGLPDRVLALEGDDLPQQVLAGVCALVVEDTPRLVPGWQRGAAAHFWGDTAWRVQRAGEAAQPLVEGSELVVGARRFRAVGVALDVAGGVWTRTDEMAQPIEIIAQYDSVHIRRAGRPVVVLAGVAARLVSELVTIGGPVAWEVLAAELWPEDDDRVGLRRRLDVTLTRLRSRLRAFQVRSDLVRSMGTGHLELVLNPGDRVQDAT